MMLAEEAYHELIAYTLSLRDEAFIHQHVVDAYAAQTATAQSKPINVVFALAGLYLLCEKKFTGRQVQKFHVLMSQHKKQWPFISLPSLRGNISVKDVLQHPEDEKRHEAIMNWCRIVWKAFAGSHEVIRKLVEEYEKG